MVMLCELNVEKFWIYIPFVSSQQIASKIALFTKTHVLSEWDKINVKQVMQIHSLISLNKRFEDTFTV